MKTNELTGALLDYWVAKAELQEFIGQTITQEVRDAIVAKIGSAPFHPSTNWVQGGPIIEQKRIAVVPLGDKWCAFLADGGRAAQDYAYTSHYIDTDADCADGDGAIPLQAAMRAYVASKFGEEVPDMEGGA